VDIVNLLLKPNILPYMFLILAIVVMCGLIFFAFKEYQAKNVVFEKEAFNNGIDVMVTNFGKVTNNLYNYVNTIFQSRKEKSNENYQGELENMDYKNEENNENELVNEGMLDDSPENVTIFSSNTVIEGNIQVESPLIIRGKVSGNIVSSSTIEILGGAIVEGNIEATSIEIDHARITGDLSVNERVFVGGDTYVKGSIKTKTMILEGSIEGDIYASVETKLSNNAQVLGNIYTSLIDIDRGAKMSGKIINDEKQVN